MLAVLDFVEVVDGAGIASAGHAILAHGGQNHALVDAFLEAAVLAPVALSFGDLAAALGHARVDPLILNGPLEKTLAPAPDKHHDVKLLFIVQLQVRLLQLL